MQKKLFGADQPNAVTVSQFFANESDVVLALNGCYQSLRDNNGLGEESDLYTDQRSDDTGTMITVEWRRALSVWQLFLLPTNSYLEKHWVALYQTIARTNTLLANINGVPFTDSMRAQYIGEAKFLRALVNFHLVRKWGDVPMTTAELSTPAQVNAATFR